MNRRGSMQLSIEAIIVLVIAIVLLGLGIAFIKSFFEKGSDALLGKFDPLKEGCDVNSETLIVPREYSLKQGESVQSNICVYNNDDKPITDGVFKIDGCIDPDGNSVASAVTTSANSPIVVNSLKQTIERSKSVGYKTTIEVANNAKIGTYICNLQVSGTGNPPGKIGSVQVNFNVN